MRIKNETRFAVLEFAYELDRQRLPSGSWHEEGPTLQSVIVTEQVLLLLARIDASLFEVSLDEGSRWLCKPEVDSSEGAAWRPLPLLLAGAGRAKTESALEHTRRLVEQGVQADANSPLRPFYVDMQARLGSLDEIALVLLDDWGNELPHPLSSSGTEAKDGSAPWKPNMLTHILAAVTAAGRFDEDIALGILGLVRKSAGGPSPQRMCWEDLNMTAYTTLNLIRFRELRRDVTPIESDHLADRLIDGGLGYVLQRWEAGDFESGTIAGADTDLANTPFHKIVAARVIVEGLRLDDEKWVIAALAERRSESSVKVEDLSDRPQFHIHSHGGDITFGQKVHIGDSRIDVRDAPFDELLSAIVELLVGELSPAAVVAQLQAIDQQVRQRGDLDEERIATAVSEALDGSFRKTSITQRLQALMHELSINTAGSLVGAGVLQGLQLLGP